MTNDITNALHLCVLEREVKILKDEYYTPNEEGTGHFNTAIGVLEYRIEKLKSALE